MRNAPTERQKQLLTVIYDFLTDTGYPPTFEEMRQDLGVASNQSVADLLERLRDGGYVKKDTGARTLAITRLGYEALGRPALAPVLGTTTAGFPAEAIEADIEWRSISKEIAEPQVHIYMLRVMGDSMVNANIEDGDMVLVQERREFVSGDIVHALVEDEATIKRFMSEDKPPYVYLKPENPSYPPIVFTDKVLLKGKVISRFKNNQWMPVK